MSLLATLLDSRRPLTRSQIGARVEGYPENPASFRRAFERDKEELREMGVAIETVVVPGSTPPEQGYRIPHDRHYLRDPGLEPDELAALHFAVGAIHIDGIEGSGALWKLGGRPTESGDPDAATGLALPADQNVVPLFQAVVERRTATFVYRDEERTVDPYRLDFLRGHWYLTGFDHLRAEERNFRVDRIEGATSLSDPNAFDHPETAVPGARMAPWQLGDGAVTTARVRVDADQAPMAVASLSGDAAVETQNDGSVILSLPVTNLAGLRSFVLGFLEHAEVLEPAEFRADVIEWLEALADG